MQIYARQLARDGARHVTAPARALGADGDVSSGGGIDDLQNRYYELNLVVLWPNYDCLTLMHHTGSSLDHLGVDQ